MGVVWDALVLDFSFMKLDILRDVTVMPLRDNDSSKTDMVFRMYRGCPLPYDPTDKRR